MEAETLLAAVRKCTEMGGLKMLVKKLSQSSQ
jgi:hypothetical protein